MLSSTLTDSAVVFELTVDRIRRWICIGGCRRLGSKREEVEELNKEETYNVYLFSSELNILDQEIHL